MKKILIIATLLFSLNNFAQKTFEVYNFTGQTVKLWDIITKPNSLSTYPEFHSKPYGAVTIPPGGSYTLVNTTNVFKFPFQSPTSIPYINKWERLNSASSTTPSAIIVLPLSFFLFPKMEITIPTSEINSSLYSVNFSGF